MFVSLDKLAAEPPHQVPHGAVPRQPRTSGQPAKPPHQVPHGVVPRQLRTSGQPAEPPHQVPHGAVPRQPRTSGQPAEPPHQVPHGAVPRQPRTSGQPAEPPPHGAVPRKPNTSDLPAASVSATSVDKPSPHKFGINDRVVVYDKKNKPKHGTICWIGRHVHTRILDSTHVGIETVSDESVCV